MAVNNIGSGMQEEVWFEWKAYSRPYIKNGFKMMGTPLVVAVLIGILLLIAMEWMLIIMLAAFVFVYYAFTAVPPEIVDYKLTAKGVKVGPHLYEWGMMARWWVEEKWEQKLLIMESTQAVLGRIAMPLGDASLETIEQILAPLLPNERPVDTNVDKMEKWVANKFNRNSEV